MLKGIDPLLSGELLHVLDTMGHADQLAVVDRNFPAASAGRPVIRLGEVGVVRAISAILSVLPLDSFVERPLERMEVDDDASVVTGNQRLVLQLAGDAHGAPLEYGVIPRLDFYERVRNVSVIIHTLEAQPWGCFILQKGVVFDD
jgi:L-fucose mutarotase